MIKRLNSTIMDMAEDAYFDMEGEGFSKENVSLMLELMIKSSSQTAPVVIRWNDIILDGENDLSNLVDLYRKEVGTDNTAGLSVQEIRLQATSHLVDPEFQEYPSVGESPEEALKDNRSIYHDGEFRDVPVYDQELLKSGNVVKGPAFVESASTTVLIPSGSRYSVDKYLNGLMEER
jgi:N-methylhydantoinase A/oxoprolinase/acetone carboxylase beta subunit